MNFFRTTFPIAVSEKKMNHSSHILTIGSCFADEMHERLLQRKFRVFHNPFGILFHPLAIENAFLRIVTHELYQPSELFHYKELYLSWDHHSSFNHVKSENILHEINSNIEKANAFLQKTDFVLITLGTSFVYELKSSEIAVANCHKIPNSQFQKRLLSTEEITTALQTIVQLILSINTTCTILFTVSPVRHSKDGFVENNVSKARLLDSVYQITQLHSQTVYFPAYELVLDDLRDYRFYKEDMLHPNEMAIQYVWNRFSEVFFDAETQKLNADIEKIGSGMKHKPFHENTLSHKEFLYHLIKNCTEMNQKLGNQAFENEIQELKTRLQNAY